MQTYARDLLPRERVAKCLRVRIAGNVAVMGDTHGRAFYSGLAVCGSVWHCPVCAAKVTERRRVELAAAMERWQAQGGAVLLATFTLQHHAQQPLADTLKVLNTAYHGFKSGGWFTRWQATTGYAGSVRALEVTHGANGWHPHIHTLLFLHDPQAPGTLATTMKERWSHVVSKGGRLATLAHGLTVQDGSAAAHYVTKEMGNDVERWSLAHEMTKATVKRGRWQGRTPRQLLADYADGDHQAGALWREYARHFKGKRLLVYTQNLRTLLELGKEKTDEETAAEQIEHGHPLVLLSGDEWKIIVGNDSRAELLNAAENGTLTTFLQGYGITPIEEGA